MAGDSIIILISGLAVVTLLVVGLMLGYICIFRQLCCPADDKSKKRWGLFSNKTQEVMQMADISNTTHIESLTTIEMDRASSASYHKKLST
jgi:hypothetical protein